MSIESVVWPGPRTIPHENASRRGPKPNYYDVESREMIGTLYAEDMEAFGYRFDGERACSNIANPDALR
jgi:hypothetical protein